jgi:hypothetical protein
VTALPNAVVAENALPGNPPSEWFPFKSPDSSIRGFTDEISYNKDDGVTFFVQTPDAPNVPFDILIYRLGYYDGNGARQIAQFSGRSVEQPPPIRKDARSLDNDANQNCFPYLIECSNWSPAWTWRLPPNIVSGLFMAKLTRQDTKASSPVFFVIRDDERRSDILVQTSDTTWNAYSSGPAYQGEPISPDRAIDGRSLYDVNKPRAFKVSYLRPHLFETTDTLRTQHHFCDDLTRDLVFYAGNEYSLIRFLERNGYDVAYFTGRDSDLRGELIKRHKLFITSGHDEYWSGRQMDNILAARDAGVHLAFFSGNTAYWKIRWEDDHHTMVCYKELSPLKLDPEPNVTTGTFRDPGFSAPNYDGYRPENALTGLTTSIATPMKFDLHVPETDGKLRFWRSTSVAELKPGQVAIFNDLLGFEIDSDVDNGVRPAGLFHLSTTELLDQPLNRLEHGGTSTVHNMTLYRHAASGAIVFHAGTMHLQRALAGFYEGKEQGTEPDIQQAVVNLFADMNVQPETLQAGISRAAATTDRAGPTVQILDPSSGADLKLLDSFVVSGSASDADGAVAAIEVSSDDGNTWHPAIGREHWYCRFTPCKLGTMSIHVRAIDDSGNIGAEATIQGLRVTPARVDDFVRNGQFTCGFVEQPNAGRLIDASVESRSSSASRLPDLLKNTMQDTDLRALTESDSQRFIPVGWSSFHKSAHEPVFTNAAMIPGINILRVVTSGDSEGMSQDVTLTPARWYVLFTRLFVEAGAVALKIGTRQTLCDPVIVTTNLIGRWQWLNVFYQPMQAECMFAISSHEGPSIFKVDEVVLRSC